MIEGLLLTLTILLCLIALVLSALGLSGTWLVLVTAIISYFSIYINSRCSYSTISKFNIIYF